MTEVLDERKGCTSASNAQADALCPGRHLAQAGIPDFHSADAEFGQKIHAALHTGDASKLDTQQLDIYESCKAIEAKVVDRIFGSLSSDARVFREQRYWAKIRNQEKTDILYEHSAKPDVVYRLGPIALICEYKTLPGDQDESAVNMQLRDQVVMVARNLIVDEVYGCVIQPLVTHDPQTVLYDAESVRIAENQMFTRVRASNNPLSFRIAGEIQCKYCKAKSVCVEYARWQGTNLPAPMSILDTPVTSWTAEQRAIFCQRKAAAQKWLDECEDAIKEMLQKDPESVPGFCLKEGNTREIITDPQELFNRFAEMGGQLDQFMTCISVTKTKLGESVRLITGTKGKELAAKMEQLTEGITEVKQNAPSIAKKK